MKTTDAAFPTKHNAMDPRVTGFHTEPGMTIRAYLAGRAMQGLLAAETEECCYSPEYIKRDGTTTFVKSEHLRVEGKVMGEHVPTTLHRSREQVLAADAVALADALIAELNKPQPAPAAAQP